MKLFNQHVTCLCCFIVANDEYQECEVYVLTLETLIITQSIINLWLITHYFPLSVSTQHSTLMQQEFV